MRKIYFAPKQISMIAPCTHKLSLTSSGLTLHYPASERDLMIDFRLWICTRNTEIDPLAVVSCANTQQGSAVMHDWLDDKVLPIHCTYILSYFKFPRLLTWPPSFLSKSAIILLSSSVVESKRLRLTLVSKCLLSAFCKTHSTTSIQGKKCRKVKVK